MNRVRSTIGMFLALLLATTGCDRAGSPDPLSVGARAVAHVRHADGYTLVQGYPPAGTPTEASAWFDRRGGWLSAGEHALYVSPDAVAQSTLFAMALATDGYVRVELTATAPDAAGGTRDVGEAGFDRPVFLVMGYSLATNVRQRDRLGVVHVREDGTLEEVPSMALRSNERVLAQLDHFSSYALVTGRGR